MGDSKSYNILFLRPGNSARSTLAEVLIGYCVQRPQYRQAGLTRRTR